MTVHKLIILLRQNYEKAVFHGGHHKRSAANGDCTLAGICLGTVPLAVAVAVGSRCRSWLPSRGIVLFFRRERKELKESIPHPRPSPREGCKAEIRENPDSIYFLVSRDTRCFGNYAQLIAFAGVRLQRGRVRGIRLQRGRVRGSS